MNLFSHFAEHRNASDGNRIKTFLIKRNLIALTYEWVAFITGGLAKKVSIWWN